MVALLGPNGAGKTTLLRAVAGLQPIDAGRVAADGDVLDDPKAGIFVTTNDRPIGVTFQDYLLFPRMTVVDNVAFGPRPGPRPGRARPKAGGARAGGDGRPGRGQATGAVGRPVPAVALAQALAIEPRVLLLDEPLAALDARAKLHIRAELRRHLASFHGARLLVTHDPVDALVLADRMVVLEDGCVTQQGTTAEVARQPRSLYVAELVGGTC